MPLEMTPLPGRRGDRRQLPRGQETPAASPCQGPSSACQRGARPPLIPRPVALRKAGAGAVLSDGMVIAADDASDGVASLLASELEAATGWRIERGSLGMTSPHGVVRIEVVEPPTEPEWRHPSRT